MYTHSSLGILRWLNAGVEQFPPIVQQLNSVRTMALSRRDANNTRGILFGLLKQFVFFPCEWSYVPVSNHQLMARSPFTRGFQVSWSRRNLRWPHSLLKMGSGVNLGPPLVDRWWGRLFRIFSNGPLCLKLERGPCLCDNRCAMGSIFLRISW